MQTTTITSIRTHARQLRAIRRSRESRTAEERRRIEDTPTRQVVRKTTRAA